MRHRRRGRTLGRSPAHQRALLRNLASALFLTERDEDELLDENPLASVPKVKGRIVTTLQKAKEVRPLVERCITIARRALPAQEAADKYATEAVRGQPEYKRWRESEEWQQWNQAIAPVLAARRRAIKLLGDKHAVRVLFDQVAPRFKDRPGGYTRVLRLAEPRLGDGGTRAILEFVGIHDRVREKSVSPAFDEDETLTTTQEEEVVEEEVKEEAAAAETGEDAAAEEAAADAGEGDATDESSGDADSKEKS
ncbi:MAG: 50S ribosomal protein L17 [Planctomycetota bacterium]|nr:MAG: 50S ribosomal protein L17 [Planctomycetota bacterium]REK48718.1 MAG: 50S ribosomal protein L17 [Planctomycetota bacterium]